MGERALLTGEPRAANCTATTKVTAFAVNRKTFNESFGSFESVMKEHVKRDILKALPVIAESKLTRIEIDKLVKKMSHKKFKKGNKIVEARGSFMQQLIILTKGEIKVSSSCGLIRTLKNGDVYGVSTIKNEELVKECSDTVVVEEDSEAYILTKQDIEDAIGDVNRLGREGSF